MHRAAPRIPLPALIAAAPALALYAWYKARLGMLISDDAYITLCHARTWCAGGRPLMSAGNPVCATTTPLFTAWLAGVHALFPGLSLEAIAYGTGLACEAASLPLIFALGRAFGLLPPFALFAAAAYGLSVLTLAVGASGMETPAFVLLSLVAAWGWLGPGGAGWRGSVSLLAPLLRPEGCLLVACHGTIAWITGRVPRREIAAQGALAALALAGYGWFFRWAYGHWLPHSILSKWQMAGVPWKAAFHSWYLYLVLRGPCVGPHRIALLAACLLGAGAAWGFLRPALAGSGDGAGRADGRIHLLLPWPAALIAFLLATRASNYLYSWYFLPPMPFLHLWVAAGWQRVKPAPRAGWALYAALVAATAWGTAHERVLAKQRAAWNGREGFYARAAALLAPEARPDDLVMIEEVGALGYWLPVRLLDIWGLVSPEVVAGRSGPGDVDYGDLARRYRPDFILLPRLKRPPPGDSVADFLRPYRLRAALEDSSNIYREEIWEARWRSPRARHARELGGLSVRPHGF